MKNKVYHIFVDLETTGTNPEVHGIHQICAIAYLDGKEVKRFVSNAKPLPNDKIDGEALKVCGVTVDQLMQYPEPIEVYWSFVEWLNSMVDKYNKKDKAYFIGYNARFDCDFLCSWFNKLGNKYFFSYFWSPPLDVMMLAFAILTSTRESVRSSMPNFKLGTVCAQVGIPHNESMAHDAVYDIEQTVRLYEWCTESITGLTS